MKIKILKYKIHRGNKVRVRSYHFNFKKRKWVKNENYEIHRRVFDGFIYAPVLYAFEYEVEVAKNDNKYLSDKKLINKYIDQKYKDKLIVKKEK